MAERLPKRHYTHAEMAPRIARFAELKGFDGGLPDSDLAECRRTLFNVIGFQPPPGKHSPVGSQAAENAAIKISEGFNLGFAKAKPGCGPLMHNHDTNETFMPITGRWRCSWNEEGTEHVELGPLDVVSFPPGVARRFMNVTEGDPQAEHILLFVISGNAPEAEFTDLATAHIASQVTAQAAE